MVCHPAPDDRCTNITAAIASSGYFPWDSQSISAPVIYAVSDDEDVASGCYGGLVPFTTTLYAYAGPNYTFPDSIGAATALNYFTSTGTKVAVNGTLVGNTTNAWSHYLRSNNGKNAEITLTLCAPSGTIELVVGFAFSEGNAACLLLTHN